MSLWPTAGEAAVTFVPWYCERERKPRPPNAPAQLQHRRSNGRRAARTVRQFVRANDLQYLWTLTYAEAAHDRAQVVRDIGELYTALQAHYGKMPLVAVIERGRRGTRRLHVHFAAPHWLDHGTIRQLWGRGFVWVGDGRKCPAHTSSKRLSAYLAKYVTKDLERSAEDQSAAKDPPIVEDRQPGRHRYLVSQGWKPERRRLGFWSIPGALEWLLSYYGKPDRVWDWQSEDIGDMHGLFLIYSDAVVYDWLHPGDRWFTDWRATSSTVN